RVVLCRDIYIVSTNRTRKNFAIPPLVSCQLTLGHVLMARRVWAVRVAQFNAGLLSNNKRSNDRYQEHEEQATPTQRIRKKPNSHSSRPLCHRKKSNCRAEVGRVSESLDTSDAHMLEHFEIHVRHGHRRQLMEPPRLQLAAAGAS